MGILFSDEELKVAVPTVVAKLEPALALDGGGVKIIDIINGKVFVQLTGACVGCSSSNTTLKYGIEKRLREEIHPEIIVVNVPFGMEDKLNKL
jgi:Fe-S cluster biogenesis protein NfuA